METNVISKLHATVNPFTLLPHLIKQNAQDNPGAVFARIPAGTKYTDGYKDVTNLEFANAIDYTANLIEKNLGKGQNFETVAYIGPGDLRYSIVVVAGAKAGYKVWFSNAGHYIFCGFLTQFKGLLTIPKEQQRSASFATKEIAMYETHCDGAASTMYPSDLERNAAADHDIAFSATVAGSEECRRASI
jgi:hypothetical protein